jgi:hypothetical protein
MDDLQTQVDALRPAMSTALPASRTPSAVGTSGTSLPTMILGAILASALPALVRVLGLSVFDPVGFAVRSALPFVCGALVYAGLAARRMVYDPQPASDSLLRRASMEPLAVTKGRPLVGGLGLRRPSSGVDGSARVQNGERSLSPFPAQAVVFRVRHEMYGMRVAGCKSDPGPTQQTIPGPTLRRAEKSIRPMDRIRNHQRTNQEGDSHDHHHLPCDGP